MLSARRLLRGVALLLFASCMTATVTAEEPPLSRLVGRQVPDFTLRDATTGKDVSLYSFAGKKGAVLIYSGTECPIGNVYMPRLVEMAKEYGPKGIVILAINANPSESDEAVARHAKEYGLPFPVLRDTDQEIASKLEVSRTCEALVLDGRARLRYRGAIDDQYTYNAKHKVEPSRSFVKDALDAMLEGREIEVTGTSVVGCRLESKARPTESSGVAARVRPPSAEIIAAQDDLDGPEPEVGDVTWSGEVAEIIQNRCQECHRPGQAAPFKLLSYDDARRWSSGIMDVVDDRRMPPWHADPRFGKFSNDRRLTPRERATLLAWVDQGSPLGDPSKAPAPREWPEGWGIGKPDQVFEMPEPFTVKADGFVNYQYFVVPTNFTEDRWIQAAEARPGDRSVVHHIIVYLQAPGESKRELGAHLCGYAPGDMPTVLPMGTAKRIPKGSNLIFQVHYTPNGKVRVDRSSLGLIFAKQPPTSEAITHGIHNGDFEIPPGDPSYEVRAEYRVPRDVKLLAFMPHMHLRGKDFQYDAVFPDGKIETLLKVPAYDFAWQSYYYLAEPRLIPEGTVIKCVAHFDNSANNPVNPDPSRPVRWGDQTFEEMMLGYIDYVVPVEKGDPSAGD